MVWIFTYWWDPLESSVGVFVLQWRFLRVCRRPKDCCDWAIIGQIASFGGRRQAHVLSIRRWLSLYIFLLSDDSCLFISLWRDLNKIVKAVGLARGPRWRGPEVTLLNLLKCSCYNVGYLFRNGHITLSIWWNVYDPFAIFLNTMPSFTMPYNAHKRPLSPLWNLKVF